MERFQYSGRVNKLKLIKADQPTLAYVELEVEQSQVVKAIIAKEALSFLYEVQQGDRIAVYGHYNDRQQFVIERYLTPNKNRPSSDLPDHLSYPPRKPFWWDH